MSYPDRIKRPTHRVDDGKARSFANTVISIRPATDELLSKSAALRCLRHFFIAARFLTKTTPADREAGNERWQLWSGWDQPLIEAAGPPNVLPKAILYGALKGIGLDATLSGGKLTFKKRATILPQEPDEHGERPLHLSKEEPA